MSVGQSVMVIFAVLQKERDDMEEKLHQQMKMMQESQQRYRQTLSEMDDVNHRYCLLSFLISLFFNLFSLILILILSQHLIQLTG